MKSSTFPRSLVALVLLIAIANGLANFFHWYYTIWWFDIPMHFWGGFWVSAVTLWALGTRIPQASFWRRLGTALAAVLVVGASWEVFEFGLDAIGDSIDTQQDLMFDMLGAITAVLTRRNTTSKK